jgi:hypothetical protein
MSDYDPTFIAPKKYISKVQSDIVDNHTEILEMRLPVIGDHLPQFLNLKILCL